MRPSHFLLTCLLGLAAAGSARSEMTLLKREMFATSGELTSASPGANFDAVSGTFHQRQGGPNLAGQPSASADMRGEGSPVFGTFTLNPATDSKVFVGAWFFIKSFQSTESQLLSIRDIYGNMGPTIFIRPEGLGAGIIYNSYQGLEVDHLNRWIFLGIALNYEGGTNGDVRFFYKFPGQPMQDWFPMENTYLGIGSVGSAIAGARTFGPVFRGRLGSPAVYSFEQPDFSDVGYPSELEEPGIGLTWHVNPLTGDDSSDGTSASTAWKTAAKINTESSYTGFLTAPDHESGDTLIIDTSGADLDLFGQTLYFRTQGLNVRAADGQEWIRFKCHKTLSSSNWQPTGTANVFSTTDTQSDIVVWENDKWLHHPIGNTFASVATELSATPGSFWTDGSQLYVHPFDSTDPRTDGKLYDRSMRYQGATPIQLGAPHMYTRDILNGKTCTAGRSDNVPIGANCLALAEFPGRSILRHCFLYYGDKHNLSLVQGAAGDDFLVDDVQCEQASPYAGAGGQTLYVSFNHKPEALGIIHRFHNCRTTANAGLIGSTEGFMQSAYPVYLSHNLGQPGEPNQFELFEFIDCDFSTGNIQGEGVNNVVLKRVRCGAVGVSSEVMAEECTFSKMTYVYPGHSAVERNCIHLLEGEGENRELRRNAIAGTVDIQGCTFDARAITGVQGGVPQSALFNREGSLSFTFRNNLVWMPPTNVNANVFAGFASADTVAMDHNAYVLGNNRFMYGYNTGSGTQNKTFAQWQALGHDANSQNLPSITLNGLLPVPGSPLIDAGQALGPLVDHTGTLFQQRNDIGAYEAPPTSYATWQAEYFTTAQLANAGVSGPDAMPANDGVSNFMKFASGLGAWEAPPAIPESQSPPFFNTGQRYWNLLYYRNTWVPGLAYTFRYSTALQGWSNATITNDELLSTTNGIETRRVTLQCGTGDQGFVQLQVSQ